ncbi:hypothetical protein MMC13_002473 [Lambiella insularis]|nr:hypothetical protein [Lambiella insularis]
MATAMIRLLERSIDKLTGDQRDGGGERGLLKKATDTALVPVQLAVSKPAQRAYLGTFLFATISLILICTSTIAYLLFYYNYVPQVGVERTIHLQFGNGHPFGVAYIASSLVPLQPYDVSLFLHLPRTPGNLAAGNFMIDLALLAPSDMASSPADLVPSALASRNTSGSVLALSRRPAILTYSSPIVDTASKLSSLPWYMIGWRRESERVEVVMFEGVEFAKGWRNVPDKVQVIVEADEKMQFYEVGVKIAARFGGLRWILYNHRILSYLFFTTTFFSVSLTSTFLAYLLLSSFLSSPPFPTKSEPAPHIKHERTASSSERFNPFSTSDLSDTARSFPTLGRQMPLHFSGRSDAAKHEDEAVKVKKEEPDAIERTTGLQPLAAEADDEDEGDDAEAWSFRDSGIGTSLEEGDWRSGPRRRRGASGGGGRGGA